MSQTRRSQHGRKTEDNASQMASALQARSDRAQQDGDLPPEATFPGWRNPDSSYYDRKHHNFLEAPSDYAWAPLAVVIAATLVAALQTFMRFSEQAETHRAAARRYGEIKKEIEYVLCFGEALTAIEQRVDEIRAKEVAVGQDAPNALTWHWRRATKDTEEENEQHSIRNQTYQAARPDHPLPRRRFASGPATGGGPAFTFCDKRNLP